ncbi:MAG TPA: hypothetical protein VME41_06820 [Stellaceae bacterium]|nr:hypothetical protein [Stellaceae bacterium]
MRRIAAGLRMVLALAVAAGIAGCTALDPFATFPKPAKPARPGQAAPAPRVAICYNGLDTSLAEVRSQAQQQCAKGTVATPAATDYLMQYCPVLLPARATFACTAAK